MEPAKALVALAAAAFAAGAVAFVAEVVAVGNHPVGIADTAVEGCAVVAAVRTELAAVVLGLKVEQAYSIELQGSWLHQGMDPLP